MTDQPAETAIIPASTAPIALRVRPADLHDLPQCLDIDAGFVTHYVWQLEEWLDTPTEGDFGVDGGNGRPQPQGNTERRSFFAGLRPSRLPRPLPVAAALRGRGLLDEWNRTDFLAIAETVGRSPAGETNDVAETVGYIGVALDVRRPVGWITTLAVQPQRRRSGIGRALLTAATDWATRHQLGALMIELSTLNYPAVAFVQRHNFAYCGYNSRVGLGDFARYGTPGAPDRDPLSRQPRAGSGDIVLYFYQRLG